MKKRVYGLLALMLAVVTILTGMPMQVQAEGNLAVWTIVKEANYGKGSWLGHKSGPMSWSDGVRCNTSVSDSELIVVDELDKPDCPAGKQIYGWKLWSTNQSSGTKLGEVLNVYKTEAPEIPVADLQGNTEVAIAAVLNPFLTGTLTLTVNDEPVSDTNVIRYRDTVQVGVNGSNAGAFTYELYNVVENNEYKQNSNTNGEFLLNLDPPGTKIKFVVTAEGYEGSLESEVYELQKNFWDSEYIPTGSSVDDTYGADSFSFTGDKEREYEYRTRKAASAEWSDWTSVNEPENYAGTGTLTFNLGNISRPADCVQVRTADNKYYTCKEEDYLTNAEPFTITLKGTASLTGEAVCGETLTASVTHEEGVYPEGAPSLLYTFKRGENVVQEAGVSNTYTLTAADVGQQITVEVTSPEAGNALTANSGQVQSISLDISGAAVKERVYDGTTAATVESVSFIKAGAADSTSVVNLVKDVDYRVVSATYNSAEAGNDKSVEIKIELIGDAASRYSLSGDTFTLQNQTITAPEPEPTPEPTPMPEVTPEPTPELTPEPTITPEIEEEEDEDEWDDLIDELEDIAEGQTVSIDLSDETIVPGDVFDSIKGKDVTITLDLGNGLSWTINGKSITSDKVPDIDFSVRVGEETIPVDVLNVVTGERFYLNVSLAYSGEFGLTAILNVDLDAKNKGLYANLFYYNEPYNVMQFMNADMIDENGIAHLVFTHASEYAIVIDKVVMDTNVVSPKTGEETGVMPYALLVAALVSVFVGAELLRKLRKENQK